MFKYNPDHFNEKYIPYIFEHILPLLNNYHKQFLINDSSASEEDERKDLKSIEFFAKSL